MILITDHSILYYSILETQVFPRISKLGYWSRVTTPLTLDPFTTKKGQFCVDQSLLGQSFGGHI